MACIVTIISITVCSYGQQSNFQVTSPPIPWYEFSNGQKDIRAGGTALYMTGEIEDPDYGGEINIYGGGGSLFYRYAFRDEFAFDVGCTLIGAAGDIGDVAKMNIAMVSVPVDIEFQPVKSSKYSVILFAGFNFTWMSLGVEFDDGADSGSVDMVTSIRGPQGGIEAAIVFENFVFTPFFMITSLSGNASIDYSDSSGSAFSASSGIPATKSYYYGIDIIYRPLGITLSSIIQQVMDSGENSGYKTYVMMLSYHFELDPGEKTFEIETVESDENLKTPENRNKRGKKYQQ